MHNMLSKIELKCFRLWDVYTMVSGPFGNFDRINVSRVLIKGSFYKIKSRILYTPIKSLKKLHAFFHKNPSGRWFKSGSKDQNEDA